MGVGGPGRGNADSVSWGMLSQDAECWFSSWQGGTPVAGMSVCNPSCRAGILGASEGLHSRWGICALPGSPFIRPCVWGCLCLLPTAPSLTCLLVPSLWDEGPERTRALQTRH